MKINKLLESKKLKEGITNTEPVVKFQGKSSHTFTKDKKWEVDFDEAGNILARTRHGKPSYFKGHINDKTNDFPSTDEDNIILAAREQHGLKFDKKTEAFEKGGYDKCYKIVKKARMSNPIDTDALNDARDHFGYDLYKMCLDDVLKEVNESKSINEDSNKVVSGTLYKVYVEGSNEFYITEYFEDIKDYLDTQAQHTADLEAVIWTLSNFTFKPTPYLEYNGSAYQNLDYPDVDSLSVLYRDGVCKPVLREEDFVTPPYSNIKNYIVRLSNNVTEQGNGFIVSPKNETYKSAVKVESVLHLFDSEQEADDYVNESPRSRQKVSLDESKSIKLSDKMKEIDIEDKSEVGDVGHPIKQGLGDPTNKSIKESYYEYEVYMDSGISDEDEFFSDLRKAKTFAKKLAKEYCPKDSGSYAIIKRGPRNGDPVTDKWEIINKIKYDIDTDTFDVGTSKFYESKSIKTFGAKAEKLDEDSYGFKNGNRYYGGLPSSGSTYDYGMAIASAFENSQEYKGMKQYVIDLANETVYVDAIIPDYKTFSEILKDADMYPHKSLWRLYELVAIKSEKCWEFIQKVANFAQTINKEDDVADLVADCLNLPSGDYIGAFDNSCLRTVEHFERLPIIYNEVLEFNDMYCDGIKPPFPPLKLNESLSESTVTRYQVEYFIDENDDSDTPLETYVYTDSKQEAIAKVKSEYPNAQIVYCVSETVPASYKEWDMKEGYEFNPNRTDISWRPYDNEKGQVMADKWYASKWPDDEVGIEQLKGITLDDALKDRSILGHCDTQVRERVYAQLDKYIPLSVDSSMYKEVNESATHCVYFNQDGKDQIEFEGSEDECNKYISDIQTEQDDEFGDEAPERFIKRINESKESDESELITQYINNGEFDKLEKVHNGTNVVWKLKEPVNEYWVGEDEYDDDFDYDMAHTNLYGGDSTYCRDCGTKKKYDDTGFSYCPKCNELTESKSLNEYYDFIKTKSVKDMDGFNTDYTMYKDVVTGKYVFVFGDNDIYGPEDGYFDWECETEEEAEEWFNSYNGFDDSDDDIDWMGESLNEEEEKSPIVHKKGDGSYLVASEDGKGYTAYNKDDKCVGNISANNENEAKSKFNSNTFDE